VGRFFVGMTRAYEPYYRNLVRHRRDGRLRRRHVPWQIHRFSRLLWKNPKKLGFAWHTKREKAGIRHAKRKKLGLPPRKTHFSFA
jgi:hypothetical protein